MSEKDPFAFPTQFIDQDSNLNKKYEELPGHAEKIEELEGVFEEFKSENSELVEGIPKSRIIINRFIKTLEDLGFMKDYLERCRLYHLLVGSTPIYGTIDSLDVENGLMEAFIKAKGEGFK